MNWIVSIKNWLVNIMMSEQSPRKMALSCCLGIYIAFSPFIGLHTGMVFLFAWLFALNGAVTLVVSKIVNNPLTVIPVYGSGHAFGCWIMKLLNLDPMIGNPSWMNTLNDWIFSHTGLSGISFWALMIGCNALGLILALVCYPLVKRYIELFNESGKERVLGTINKSKEAARNLVDKATPVIMNATKRRAHRNA